ncbi:hypothetical protein [Shewanella holmiensis]|uniref:Tetratricopeptide repeat protein n=1 Tax=Shewanella holmiensis TaxID=2952222 RepID=A0A9X2WNE9_9GAMM|nr:hypothetical protein [Shewanella holmiensis]MCT7942428.1 hypothetical protein [Shewanella holmiensis]
MGSLVCLLFTCVVFLMLGFSIDAAAIASVGTSDLKNSSPIFNVWPLFLTVAIAGSFGGFVHALESDKTHVIKVPFHGDIADSGIWGHIFIGICGAFVAIAVVLAIFGLDVEPLVDKTKFGVLSIKLMFYIAGISIVGGYSGLPIISLISSAALKKVQKQVEALENSDIEKSIELKKFSTDFAAIQAELDAKVIELKEVTAKSVLLTAESHAKNGFFLEAIEIIINEYLPEHSNDPKAYHWLALCEKRRGNLKEALSYVSKSIELKKSRLAYFNFACYKNLLDFPKVQVYDALRSAWKYADTEMDRNRFLSGLKEDEDLASLRESEQFKALIAECEAS